MSTPAIANPFESAPAVAAPDPSKGGAVISNPFDTPSTSTPSAPHDAGFLSGLYNTTLHPVGQILSNDATYAKTVYQEAGDHLKNGDYLKAAGSLLGAMTGSDERNPMMQVIGGILQAHKAEVQKSIALAKQGRYTESAGHGLAAVVPAIGPAAAKAGEDIGSGKTGEGLGETAGLLAAATAPAAIRGISKAAPVVAEGAGTLASGTKALVTDIPAEVETNLVKTIGDAAEDAGLERPTASTLKESVADVGDKFKTRAQTAYQQLDEEAPGFQEARDKIGQLQRAYKTQLNLDPAKANEIQAELKTAQANMDELLDDGQKAQWRAADADYSRYKALQQVGIKTAKSAEDLTDPALTDVNKLHSTTQSLTNATRSGNPIDLLSKAFGEHAEEIRSIVQKGADVTSNAQAAKLFLKWAGIGGGLITGGYEGLKHALSGGSK